MNKHLTGVMAVALAAAVLLTTPAFADHRPGNVVVIGGTLSLTAKSPASRLILEGRKLYLDELNARAHS